MRGWRRERERGPSDELAGARLVTPSDRFALARESTTLDLLPPHLTPTHPARQGDNIGKLFCTLVLSSIPKSIPVQASSQCRLLLLGALSSGECSDAASICRPDPPRRWHRSPQRRQRNADAASTGAYVACSTGTTSTPRSQVRPPGPLSRKRNVWKLIAGVCSACVSKSGRTANLVTM